MVWKDRDHSGNKKQRELKAESMTIKELVSTMTNSAAALVSHVARIQWTMHIIELDIFRLAPNEILVFTNFAATLNLRAIATINCSVDEHGTLATYVVISHRRHVVLNNNTKEICYINDCALFQFLGETLEKGKKNEYVTANDNMGEVLRIMARYLFDKYGIILACATKWTDNCPTQ
jgi:hypothetical protein